MKSLWIYPYYISWHYTSGIKDLLRIWQNFLWFLTNFFSFGIMLKTLFSPFQRLQEHYRGGLDIQNFFSVLIVNLIMRTIGFLMRLTVISLGLISFAVTVIAGVLVFIIWLVLPLIMLFIFIVALKALFNLPS